jgi:ribonuclease E
MRDESHKRDVERRLWEQLKNDRARTKMLRMSRFGLIEMTRQRIRRNIEVTDYQTCPACKGVGQIRNPESTVLETLRRIRSMAIPGKTKRLVVRLHPNNLVRLQNERRQELVEIERNWGGRIILEPLGGDSDSATDPLSES